MRALLAIVLVVPALSWADEPRGPAAAEAALEGWDIPRAAHLAEGLLESQPDSPELEHLLGRVRLNQGRYEEAAQLLAAAGASGDQGTFLDVARASARITKDFAQVESPHFVFRFPKGKDEILASYALETLERAWDQIGGTLGYRPEDKVRVEVVSDGKELSEMSTLSLEAIKTTGTVAICKFDKLIITSPRALVRGYEWRDTLAHELTHLLITRRTHNHTPIWIHEGIAKFMETAWRGPPGLALELPSEVLLRDAVKKDKLISFARMHPSIALLPTAEDAALAFAEVFSVMEFLQGRDSQSVARVLSDLREGKSDQASVADVFGAPFTRFESAWKSYLKTRNYPAEAADLQSLRRTFKDDPQTPDKIKDDKNGWRDLTEMGVFAGIADPQARKAAHLAELLREHGKPAAAAGKYREALDRTGNRYPILANKYAIALLEVKQPAQALDVLEGSRKLYPSDPLTNLDLARCHMEMGHPDRARPFLINSLSVNPFDPEVQVRLASVARELGDGAQADAAARAYQILMGSASPTEDQTAEKQVIGWLAIESDAVARVMVDGADTGMSTPVARLGMGPGKHKVRLERVDGAGSKDFDVDVKVGETTDLRAALAGS